MTSDFAFILYLVLAIGIVIVVSIFMRKRHHRIIEEKMDDLGAVLISCKAKYGYFKVGPYKWVGRYNTIYYFEYTVDGEAKDGWVNFRPMGEPDWRL